MADVQHGMAMKPIFLRLKNGPRGSQRHAEKWMPVYLLWRFVRLPNEPLNLTRGRQQFKVLAS